MDKLINLLQSKKLVIDSNIVKVLDKNMSLNEFLVLLYILNDEGQNFDINKISRELNINNDDVMNAFNNLLNKNLIKIVKTTKNNRNHIVKKQKILYI